MPTTYLRSGALAQAPLQFEVETALRAVARMDRPLPWRAVALAKEARAMLNYRSAAALVLSTRRRCFYQRARRSRSTSLYS
ncbi:MAG: hypothetical protein QOG67_2319 [Verrucomicrobiota bacterium]